MAHEKHELSMVSSSLMSSIDVGTKGEHRGEVAMALSSNVMMIIMKIRPHHKMLICLADLEFDYINPYDATTRVNKLVLPEYFTQGGLCVFSLFTWHWAMTLLCLPFVYYNYRLYVRKQHLVDVTEIFNLLSHEKKVRLFKLGYLV